MHTSSPILLAIETATSACSVALRAAGELYECSETGDNIHSRVLLSMVQEVLQAAQTSAQDINAVAVGQGPGSFTGLRIGVGVAQGLAYGARSPMLGVSSLDVLARQSTLDGRVIAAIDARMGEVYWCEYLKQGDTVLRQTALQVSAPSKIETAAPGGCALVGNAWAEYWGEFDNQLLDAASHLENIIFPSASTLLDLAASKYAAGEGVSAGDFALQYVRNDVARKSASNTHSVK